MATSRIAAHRTYMGWDVFHDRIHNGLNWTARKDDGSKLRAETLGDIQSSIRLTEGRHAHA